MKKRLHYIQHVPFETPGAILEWARRQGFQVNGTRVFLNDPFPSPSNIDFLVIMGGPMSVHDESQYPWLSEEKAFIRETLSLEDGPKVLGICLGAQLLAEALGADVFPGRYKEIGWFLVEFTSAALAHPLFEGFPERLEVFHWHGETFSLPNEAVHLARSEACENQAFLYEEKVLALQFHLEVTTETVAALIENCPEDLTPGPYVQSVEEIKGQNELFETIHEYLFKLLDAFVRL